ncbi:uncharacterized protein PV07_08123 [Cladophialophora immunda]|uniref:Uncharacterized protein n=1 Tax=Cladophialophora immunda TaxID=569365 RepID=A0A0D2CXY6_9EURO|nr:uncharacterized protein PV07_08123 [Cladophialophora immunda]KIW28459.1 hypothetical protein PV07_08123 [Cladophialophora immunda]
MCYTRSTLLVCPDCHCRFTSADYPTVDKICSSSSDCRYRNRHPLPQREEEVAKRCSRCHIDRDNRYSHGSSTRQDSRSVIRESERGSGRSGACSGASRTWTIDSNTSTIRDHRDRSTTATTTGSRSRTGTSRNDSRDRSSAAHERDSRSSLSRSRTVSTSGSRVDAHERSHEDRLVVRRDRDGSRTLSDMFGDMSVSTSSSRHDNALERRRSHRGDRSSHRTGGRSRGLPPNGISLNFVSMMLARRHTKSHRESSASTSQTRNTDTTVSTRSRASTGLDIPFEMLLDRYGLSVTDIEYSLDREHREVQFEIPRDILQLLPPGDLFQTEDNELVWAVCERCLAEEGGWGSFARARGSGRGREYH